MTKRSGRSAENDPVLAQVLGADVDAVCLVGKSWDFQVDVALEIPREENVDNIGRSIEAVVAKKREALLDAEHFFDGYKANPDYALACIHAAHEAGHAGSCCATPMGAPCRTMSIASSAT